jgi:hypothetical protein
MTFVTKPNKVSPKELIKSETINQIIQGLEDIENFLESVVKVVQDHIEYGKVENIPTSSVTTLTYNVTFTKQFTSNPFVFLSVENLDSFVDISFWVSDVTTTSFTLNIKVIRVRPNTYCNINWLAIL